MTHYFLSWHILPMSLYGIYWSCNRINLSALSYSLSFACNSPIYRVSPLDRNSDHAGIILTSSSLKASKFTYSQKVLFTYRGFLESEHKALTSVTRYEKYLISVAYNVYEQAREECGSTENCQTRTIGQTLVPRGSVRRQTAGGTHPYAWEVMQFETRLCTFWRYWYLICRWWAVGKFLVK